MQTHFNIQINIQRVDKPDPNQYQSTHRPLPDKDSTEILRVNVVASSLEEAIQKAVKHLDVHREDLPKGHPLKSIGKEPVTGEWGNT